MKLADSSQAIGSASKDKQRKVCEELHSDLDERDHAFIMP